MLTIASNPIAASTMKPHGSETRTAPGHNPLEGQGHAAVANAATGVGLDASTILANVNAEAATAGNRTILQTLALAVAARLDMSRRNDESMEAFFQRIAAALDALPKHERATLEIRTGLKALKVQIPDLAAALKHPESALAARLSAVAEAPLATPQKTAAAAATTTYLQEGAGVTRAAETLAMVTQAKSNAEGNGIFSSSHVAQPVQQPPGEAKGLQTQLQSLFEPGVAETRKEIATRVEDRYVLILGVADDLPEVPEPAALQASPDVETFLAAAEDATPAMTESGAQPGSERTSPARTEHRPEQRLQAPPVAQNNNVPGAETRLRAIAREIIQDKARNETRITDKEDSGDHRMQTLLTLKGIAEVISSIPAKAAELFMPPPEAAEAKEKSVASGQPMSAAAAMQGDEASEAGAQQVLKRDGTANHHALASAPVDADEAEEASRRTAHADQAESQAAAAVTEQERAVLQRAPAMPEAVPFACAPLQPARDEFKAEAAEERESSGEDGANAGEGEPEDEEARRERLARKATDDLLRSEPETEPELRITRDSSEADRAYALYQRMGGF